MLQNPPQLKFYDTLSYIITGNKIHFMCIILPSPKNYRDCHLPDYQMVQNPPWHWLDSQSFCSWHLSGRQRWPFEREICKFHFTSIVFRPGSISNFTKHIVCTHFPKPQWPPSKHGSCRAQMKKITFLSSSKSLMRNTSRFKYRRVYPDVSLWKIY